MLSRCDFMSVAVLGGGAHAMAQQNVPARLDAVRLYAGPQQGWFTKEEAVLGGIGVDGRIVHNGL
jgi:hypothetical protein